MNAPINTPTAEARFLAACLELDRLEGVEPDGDRAGSMFQSDADLSADVSSYFNRSE